MSTSAPLPFLLLACLCLAACGHPATEKECEEILERSAELELRGRNITDPEIIKNRVAAARTAKRDKLMELCIGRRITDGAMSCIRGAPTSEELEACLQ